MTNKPSSKPGKRGPLKKGSAEASFNSGLSPSDQAVIAGLRAITPAQAAKIARRAGIVDEAGNLNPIFAPTSD